MTSMRKILMIFVGCFMVLAMIGAVYYYLSLPTRLTIAVGPPESDDVKMVEAIAHRLQTRHDPIQLKVTTTNGSPQSVEAIDTGKTDLAVTRGDLPKQPNAGVMLTLHRDAVLILATRASKIKKIPDLKGRKVGVVRVNTGSDVTSINTELFKSVLSYYSIPDTDLSIIPVTISDVVRAVAANEFEALFVVTPAGEAVAVKAVEAMAKGDPAGPVFVPISEPDALVFKYPNLVKDEIVRGAYGGQPAKPATSIETISVPHNIVASNSLADNTVADLTRSIFRMKTVLTREVRLAARIQAPSTDKDAASPLHPGAAAYIDDEEQSFFDRYGDIFYIGSMLLGVFASAIAALFSRSNSAARKAALDVLEHGLALLSKSRAVKSLSEIEPLETEADRLLAQVVRNAAGAHLNTGDIASFNLTLQQIRDTLQTKRATLMAANGTAQAGPISDIQDRLARSGITGRQPVNLGPTSTGGF